ncbi:MAG: DUF2961 domain-containing protein [Deltaproteobacteria bacterium]|nr:DUF2961 domain-containing protein [Deltaproteobacteria bacterium]
MRRLLLALALSLAGCTQTPAGSDGGHLDAGPSDAGGVDAGNLDAGHVDAGPNDAGPNDAGPSDAGPEDAGSDAGASLPLIPLGLDAYRQWSDWPRLRIGMRTVMRSTFDRAGGNEGADASHFLREDSAGHFVATELAGPGALVFFRTNHWHGSPWHEVVDGTDQVVTESSTANPNNPVAGSVFLPQNLFPNPLTWTWSITQGADLNWVPMPFTSSFQIAYERTHYGTGYYIINTLPVGAENLVSPLTAWTPTPPGDDVLALIADAGTDLAPATGDITSNSGTVTIPASGSIVLADLTGPAQLRAIKLTANLADATSLESVHIRITWDSRSQPSVDAPLPLFFGTGNFYNRTGREYLVKAFPVTVREANSQVELSSYFPMPYFHGAHVELVGGGTAVSGVTWELRSEPLPSPTPIVGYFHATYVDQGTPTAGQDLVLLDTNNIEGSVDWCGQLVGTAFTFSDQAVLTTLEGDPRFFFDDSQSPQAQGTGTEEWGGGGDYWGGQTMTLPFAGHPTGAPDAASAQAPADLVESAYRYLLADLFPFGRNARIQLEHGGTDQSVEHYRTLTSWYGLPGACLVPVDSLHVSDVVDEQAHNYQSPNASTVDTVTSRYEWGVDTLGSTTIFPATTDEGRHTTGASEFTLSIDSDNFGLVLRRKMDQSFPDQRATVEIADPDGGAFASAGVWLSPGSNSCVYSNPPGELDAPLISLETSNRQWREDEFLVPQSLTRGRSAVRVRLTFTPNAQPLLPDAGAAPAAWSEFRYWAYAWKLPTLP